MRATFRQQGESHVVLRVEPETDEERMLLAAFLQYDANAISANVVRFPNGLIDVVTLEASLAR